MYQVYIHNIRLIDGKAMAKKPIKCVCLDISQVESEFGGKGIKLTTLFNRVIDDTLLEGCVVW